MKATPHPPKTRISAVVPVFIARALRDFQKSAGLKSMSAAAAEALADWAQEAQRDARVKKAVAKFGPAFKRDASFAAKRAKSMGPLFRASRPVS